MFETKGKPIAFHFPLSSVHLHLWMLLMLVNPLNNINLLTTTTPFHSDIKAIKFRLRPSTIDYVIFLFLQVSSIRCCAIKLLPLSQPVKQQPNTIALFAKDCKYNIPTFTRSGQHEAFLTLLLHFTTSPQFTIGCQSSGGDSTDRVFTRQPLHVSL